MHVHLKTLRLVIFINAANRALSIDTPGLGKFGIFFAGTMDIFLEYRLRLDLLEFGLEVFQARCITTAIGSAASVGHVKTFVLNFFAIDTPVVVSMALV
jgi:hypothetical protein